MKIYAKTRKSHFWNEDRFVIGDNFLMVIDGASPLIKNKKFNEARWLVSYLKVHLKNYKGNIKEKLLELNKEAYLNMPNKEEDYLPSASMSWIEWDDKNYYINVLGDCEVTCITNNNKVIRYYDDTLTKLDDIAIAKMIKISKEKQIDILSARPYVNDMLIEHRKLANKPNGYNAFVLNSNPIINAKSYIVPKEDIKEVYLYSDGFSEAFGCLKIYNSHQDMFMKSLDLDIEINKIVSTSFKDNRCNNYPRFKKIDDITVIKMSKEM